MSPLSLKDFVHKPHDREVPHTIKALAVFFLFSVQGGHLIFMTMHPLAVQAPQAPCALGRHKVSSSRC